MMGSYQVAGSLFPELSRLHAQLEELFQPAATASIRALARGAFPAINVGRTADSVEVFAFAPGIDPKEIEITIDRGLLSLAGERRGDTPEGQISGNTYARERFTGRFRRVVSLPEDADPAKVQAKFRDGILHVTIAKRESSKPRQISVD